MDRSDDDSPWLQAEKRAQAKDAELLREMANDAARAMRVTWDRIQNDWRNRR